MQKRPRGDYSRFLNVLKIAERTRQDSTVKSRIKYMAKEDWESRTRSEQLRLSKDGVTVVKHPRRYFKSDDAQKYFDKGSDGRDEPVLEGMLRLGIDPRSISQIDGKQC